MPDGNGPAQRGWTLSLRAAKQADTLEIAIYDDIGDFWGEGFPAKEFLARLQAAPSAKRIVVRINSAGGIVDDAKAMVNLLAERAEAGALVEARVDGMAASAASYLTTVASRVVMPANAMLMLHESHGVAFGRANDMATAAEAMRKTNEQMAAAYAAASARRGKKKTKADYLSAMAGGDVYLTAEEAVAWGLADAQEAAIKVAACRANLTLLAGTIPPRLREAPYVISASVETPNERPGEHVPNDSPIPEPAPIPPPEPAPAPPSPSPVAPPEPANAPAPAGPTVLVPVEPPEQPTRSPLPAAHTPPVASKGHEMPEAQQQPAAATEPASVTISGVKLLGCSTEAEAQVRITALQNLSIALLGMTEKPNHDEALHQIRAWKLGSDQATVLATKVSELEASTRIARRDGAIERLSREGRLAPAAHEWARQQFATAESLETFALTLPPMASLGPREPGGQEGGLKLTAEEQKLCRDLGISEEVYLDEKKLEAKARAQRAGGV